MEFATMVLVLGIFSFVSVLYKNSLQNTKQLSEVIELLRTIANKP